MECSENALQGQDSMEGSRAAVEIKIKTLDSQVYTCRVEKNVSVPDLKEQIALVTGVPSESQRLICRGKVLRDEHSLSAYEVEDGHTLHLVTRPATLPSVSTAIEEQESHDYSSHIRSGHVSHSVLVGTFNFPDRNNGFLPELNRIFSSVLSSLQVGSYFLPALGTGNGTFTSLHSSENTLSSAQEAEQHAEQISDERLVDQAMPVIPHNVLDSTGGLSDPRNETSHAGALPGVSHVRILHQIVPNALRTLSQHVDRMEQIYTARNEQVQILSPNLSTDTQTQSASQQFLSSGEDWNPAAWGSLFCRIQELLANQAVPDLRRLANQLETEPSLETTMAHGSFLFTGMILEQLGRLLLNLGCTAMAMSREPAHLGGVSASTAESAPHQSGELNQYVNNTDLGGNMDIHIHAGLPSFLVARNLLSQTTHDGPSLSLTIDSMRHSIDDHGNGASNTNLSSYTPPPSLESLQEVTDLNGRGAQSAELPELLQEPLLDASNGSRGLFYPLLTFQQVNPSSFSRVDSLDHSRSEGGSSIQRDLGCGDQQHHSPSVLQALIQTDSEQESVDHFVTREQSAPATLLLLEACEQLAEPGVSNDRQDVARPLFHHVLEALPTAAREREQPNIDQGHPNAVSRGKLDAETSLRLKCTGQAPLDLEGDGVSNDRLLLTNSPCSTRAVSSDDGKICSTVREIEAFSEGLQSDQLRPFLCRTRLGLGYEEPRNLEDSSSTAGGGSILQDFLSTLACRKEETSHLQRALTESSHDLSLVIENVDNQGLGLNCSSSNVVVSPLSSPQCMTERLNPKQLLEIGLDTFGSPSELEVLENDSHRSAIRGIRLSDSHDGNCNDDVRGLQQFFPVAHIPRRICLSPSLRFDESDRGKSASMDSGGLVAFQEFSAAANFSDDKFEELKRHISDSSLEGLPAVKRQKML